MKPVNSMEELNKGYEFIRAQIAELESLRARLAELEKQEPLYIVFDGQPGHQSPAFVEVENATGQSRSIGHWEQKGDYWTLGPVYSAPVVSQQARPLPFAILQNEMADLERFHECAMDDEGYDVPKARMKRLSEIGLVRRVSANYYEHTTFGLSVLNGDFSPLAASAIRQKGDQNGL